jgi:tetratricopeptide (TPR) repeat protein
VSQPLFEQYRDALRRGHAALLEGRLDEALEAYAQAARLVPDRALPHASAAAALLQLRRPDEALEAFERALRLSPDDEATLRARAGALRDLGRSSEAAADLDRLAAILAAAGRTEAALDAARGALHLEATDARRAEVARLEAPETPPPGPPPPDAVPAPPDPAPAPLDAAADGPADPGADWPAIDLPSPPMALPAEPADPETLVANAAELLAAGSTDAARDQLLQVVAIHRAAGRPDAALDACFQLLSIAPGDPAVHLAIANVQLDRGWSEFASDKIGLLLRLTTLTGDTQAAADTHALAAERLRDDPRPVSGR